VGQQLPRGSPLTPGLAAWWSKQVPLGGIMVADDAAGKVTMKLVNFSSGK
jgi:hypothetical protein